MILISLGGDAGIVNMEVVSRIVFKHSRIAIDLQKKDGAVIGCTLHFLDGEVLELERPQAETLYAALAVQAQPTMSEEEARVAKEAMGMGKYDVT